MNTALIIHPAYSPVLPLYTARELMLAAACLGLKSQVVEQATKIATLEERNRALTKALHRQACTGFIAMDYLVVLAVMFMIAAALPTFGWLGVAYAAGALVVGMGVMLYFARRACEFWDDHHTPIAPAAKHMSEPDEDATIHMPPLGEVYADESEWETFERAIPTHP